MKTMKYPLFAVIAMLSVLMVSACDPAYAAGDMPVTFSSSVVSPDTVAATSHVHGTACRHNTAADFDSMGSASLIGRPGPDFKTKAIAYLSKSTDSRGTLYRWRPSDQRMWIAAQSGPVHLVADYGVV